jgi:hypothetical protein
MVEKSKVILTRNPKLLCDQKPESPLGQQARKKGTGLEVIKGLCL